MYSIVYPNESALRLITEDFTIVIGDEIGINDQISSNVVIVDVDSDDDGPQVIMTDTEKRAYSYYDSYPITSRYIHIPCHLFHNIFGMLQSGRCNYVPHSEQVKIMELLGGVLY